MWPERLRRPLQVHLERVQEIHQHDLRKGGGRAYLPFALERKYRNANRSWSWQYAFPAAKVSTDPRSGEARRHHVSEKNLQKAVKAAIERAGIRKAASCHTLRHSLLPIYWKTGMISALCKNCSLTRMCRPQ
jgi:integrase